MDYPRFEPVRGARDNTHRHYHGGRLVDLVLQLVDRWRGKHVKQGTSSMEIHERPTRPASPRPVDPVETLDRILLEDCMSRDFVIASARTRALQAGVLVALVAMLGVIIARSVADQRPDRGTLSGPTAAPPTATAMVPASRQHLLAGSEAYRAEKCAGDYVCDEDGAWDTVYPTRSPMVRAEAEDDPTKLGRKTTQAMGDKAQASRIGQLPGFW